MKQIKALILGSFIALLFTGFGFAGPVNSVSPQKLLRQLDNKYNNYKRTQGLLNRLRQFEKLALATYEASVFIPNKSPKRKVLSTKYYNILNNEYDKLFTRKNINSIAKEKDKIRAFNMGNAVYYIHSDIGELIVSLALNPNKHKKFQDVYQKIEKASKNNTYLNELIQVSKIGLFKYYLLSYFKDKDYRKAKYAVDRRLNDFEKLAKKYSMGSNTKSPRYWLARFYNESILQLTALYSTIEYYNTSTVKQLSEKEMKRIFNKLYRYAKKFKYTPSNANDKIATELVPIFFAGSAVSLGYIDLGEYLYNNYVNRRYKPRLDVEYVIDYQKKHYKTARKKLEAYKKFMEKYMGQQGVMDFGTTYMPYSDLIYLKNGLYKKALSAAENNIAWKEKSRKTYGLSQKQKENFFTETSVKSVGSGYRTAILANYYLYKKSPSEKRFNNFINSMENMRSRIYKEKNKILNQNNFNVRKFQKSLKQDELILGYVYIDEKYLLYTVSKNAYNVNILKNSATVNSLAQKIKSGLEDPTSDIKLLEKQIMNLSSIVLPKDITHRKQVYLLSDYMLNFIPFDVLSTNSKKYEPLIKQLSIVSLPTLFIKNKNKNKNTSKDFIGISNPVFKTYTTDNMSRSAIKAVSPDAEIYFSPLPETYDEVKTISNLFAENETSILNKEKATLSTLKKIDLSKYKYIHMATHGILGNEVVGITEPSLVLGEEKGKNSFLTRKDINAMNLNADLTVLSACNTGSGKYSTGEGVMGVGQAFLNSGSKNVIMSLWQVPSNETVLLMTKMYTYIQQGQSAASALRLAKLDLINNASTTSINRDQRGLKFKKMKNSKKKQSSTQHPFYWAAFINIGS